jgi:hypothetical protein
MHFTHSLGIHCKLHGPFSGTEISVKKRGTWWWRIFKKEGRKEERKEEKKGVKKEGRKGKEIIPVQSHCTWPLF